MGPGAGPCRRSGEHHWIALERILFDKSADGDGSVGGVDCSFVNANLEPSSTSWRMAS